MRDWIKDREMLRKLDVITLMQYVDTTEERLKTLQSECEEQARLLGMSAEREAALLAEVERLKQTLAKRRHKIRGTRVSKSEAGR